MSILSVKGISKRFRDTVAADKVSFETSQGRLFGLLGPNGAGKTTVIRMITNILIPDEGKVLFREKEVGPWSQERMGYLPEERGLYRKMKVIEQLLYLARLKGLSSTDAKKKIAYWLERFEADTWAGKKTEELSKGMQQKIQFIATLVHDPELYIFDEPFSGLDPINSDLLREVIVELKDQGKTILFSSHRMEQVEQMCDDICLISRGKVVLSGELREVKKSFGRNTIVLEWAGSDQFLNEFDQKNGFEILSRTKNRSELRISRESDAQSVLRHAMNSVELYRFELVEPSLNDIFIRVVGEEEAKANELRKSMSA